MLKLFPALLSVAIPLSLVASETREKPEEMLLRQIAGIVAIDELCTNETVPLKQLAHGSYRAPSVDNLSEWLTSPLKTLFRPDPVIMEFAQTIPDDFEHIRPWCIELVQQYAGARKQPLTPYQTAARKALRTVISKDPDKHNGLRERVDKLSDADKKLDACEAIRKNMVSFCALRTARNSYMPTKSLTETSIPELLKAGGNARALYEELAIEEYQNRCDYLSPRYLPQALQQLVESFLYDPYKVMKNLHTIETNLVGTGYPLYTWFLVGPENFAGIHNNNGRVINSMIYGIFESARIHDYIADAVPQGTFDSIKSIDGDSNNHHVQLNLSSGNKHILLRFNNALTSQSSILTIASEPTSFYVNPNNIILSTTYSDNIKNTRFEIQKSFDPASTKIVAIPGNWTVATTDDSMDKLVACGHYPELPSLTYKKLLIQTLNTSQGVVRTIKEISSPMLAVGHAKKIYALAGCNERGVLVLQGGSTLESNVEASYISFTGKFTCKHILFSHDDSHIFIAVNKTEEGKKSADQYYMINYSQLIAAPDSAKLRRCPAPSLRISTSTPLMTAADPYGEYIGCHLQHDNIRTTKVIPTDYHLAKNLVPGMQRMCYEDRQALYLLDEAIRRAPGAAHISPEQWKSTFKRLGLLHHLFFRPLLRLTTRDGTKLQGLLESNAQQPEKPVRRIKRSLSGMHAVYAASRIE